MCLIGVIGVHPGSGGTVSTHLTERTPQPHGTPGKVWGVNYSSCCLWLAAKALASDFSIQGHTESLLTYLIVHVMQYYYRS